jgi:hypothetical protein
MLMLPATTLGHAVALGMDNAITKTSMFIDADKLKIREAFKDL